MEAGAKARILVADDNRLARTLLRDTLEPGGYDVVEARDGREAVQKFREGKPQLVVIDLMMPDKSGMEALADIQKLDPDSRILVISSLDSPSLRDSARASGAVGYIVKPFHPLEVIDAVKRALGEPHD